MAGNVIGVDVIEVFDDDLHFLDVPNGPDGQPSFKGGEKIGARILERSQHEQHSKMVETVIELAKEVKTGFFA